MDQDNQQETPTEGDIAWLAGAIDCDGSVMLSCHVRNDRARSKVGVEIKLYNTDGGIIARAIDIVTRLNLSHYIAERPQKKMIMKDGSSYGSPKNMLMVSVKKLKDAYILAKLLYPWMAGEKASRLALIIQYLARRLEKLESDNSKTSRFAAYDRGDCELIVEFYRRFVTRPGHNRHLVEGLLRD